MMDDSLLWIGLSYLILFIQMKCSYRSLEKLIRRYKEYGITAEVPFNRAKVLILGDEGAGKTSTRKRLCGEGFCENMPRTVGIEITNVTHNWKKVKSLDDDFEKIASYATIKEYFRRENVNTWNVLALLCVLLGIYIGMLVLFAVPEQTSSQINYLLIIAGVGQCSDLVFSGGFSFSDFTLYLTVSIFGYLMIGTAYRRLVLLVIYDVNTLFLFDGIFLSIASSMFVVCRGILLGLLLMARQVELLEPNQGPLSGYFPTCRLSTFIFIEHTFRRFLKHYFSKIANTIYLMVCMSLIIAIKTMIVFGLDFEQGSTFLRVLYIYTWGNIHWVYVGLHGHSMTDCSRMPLVLLKLGIGLIIGIAFFMPIIYYIITNDSEFGVIIYVRSIIMTILSIVVFMAVKTYIWMKCGTDIPMHHLNSAAAEYKFGSCSLDGRWIICDFSGQQIYYDTHNVFIPRQGVFLVVFDASKFISNGTEDFRAVVERVQFWVQSVAIHADEENSVVFVIGTHTNSLNDDQLRRLSQALHDKLYHQYHRILAFNKSRKRMVYFIENKDAADQESKYLRMAIGEEAATLPFVKKEWPIRYHLFQRLISSKRQLNEYVIKKSSLAEEIVKHCKLKGERKAEDGREGDGEEENRIKEEVHNILTFFNRSGDIFYEPTGVDDDEEYVIICLQILLDVVTALANVPPPYKRERLLAAQLRNLEEQCIFKKQYLTDILCKHNIDEKYFEMMIDVLIRKEILFPCGEHKFRLLCNLPECEVSKVEPKGKVVVLYATFKMFCAESVFLHLLSRLDNIQHDEIYRNAAKFKESRMCRYVVRVRKTNEKGPSFKIFESDVLKILIKCEDCSSALDVVFKIQAEIDQVIYSTRGTKENENLFNIGHLCMDCGALIAISPDQGRDVLTSVPDSFHTVKITKEKVILTCDALVKEKQD